eukprot:TRINITY_DN823_c0_g1_i3.p1 TRINITY_DN823_c0_g1~~TRINITY_DN823_c0_g1_i3.p1  ORF type:complete len:3996 (-),score=1299.11 TRINITY_DN823_c0_g1_i3:663-12608(-)
MSESVKLEIQNLFVVLGPCKVDVDEYEQRQAAKKASELEQAAAPQEIDESFFTRIATTIVDNIQISIENVHIRYEDDESNPERPFACGITLHNFLIHSTDSSWKKTYVSSQSTIIHKMIELDHLSMYWDTRGVIVNEDGDYNIQDMLQSIPVKSRTTPHQYILLPVDANVKLRMHKRLSTDMKEPRINASIQFEQVAFAIEEEQYKDIRSVLWYLNVAYPRRIQYAHLKPDINDVPRKSVALQQWHYAVAVLISQRQEYIFLYGILLDANRMLTDEQDDRITSLEKELPIDVILNYRDAGQLEYQRKEKYMRSYLRWRAHQVSTAQSSSSRTLSTDSDASEGYSFQSHSRPSLTPSKRLTSSEKAGGNKETSLSSSSSSKTTAKTSSSSSSSTTTTSSSSSAEQSESWWDWMWGSSTDKQTRDQAKQELYSEMEYDPEDDDDYVMVDTPPTSDMLISFQLNRGSFTLKCNDQHRRKDLIRLDFRIFKLIMYKKPDNTTVTCSLKHLKLKDLFNSSTKYAHIMYPRSAVEHNRGTGNRTLGHVSSSSSSSNSQFRSPFMSSIHLDELGDDDEDRDLQTDLIDSEVSGSQSQHEQDLFNLMAHYSPNESELDLKVHMASMIIVYNHKLLSRVQSFFSMYDDINLDSLKMGDRLKTAMNRMAKQIASLEELDADQDSDATAKHKEFIVAFEKHLKIKLDLNVHAPQILIPEDCCSDKGTTLMIDLGSCIGISDNADNPLSSSSTNDGYGARTFSHKKTNRSDTIIGSSQFYDKFQFQVNNIELLLMNPKEASTWRRTRRKPANCNLVDRVQLDFLVELSQKPLDANMFQMKITGTLGQLNMHMSFVQYHNLQRLLATLAAVDPPKQQKSRRASNGLVSPRAGSSSSPRASTSSASSSSAAETSSSSTSSSSPRDAFGVHFSYDNLDATDTLWANSNGSNNFNSSRHKSNFRPASSMSLKHRKPHLTNNGDIDYENTDRKMMRIVFHVDSVSLDLHIRDPKRERIQQLVNIQLEKLHAEYNSYSLYTKTSVMLNSLVVDDLYQSHGNEFQYLITSVLPESMDNELIKVTHEVVKRGSPKWSKSFKGDVQTLVDIQLCSLYVHYNRYTIGAVIDFFTSESSVAKASVKSDTNRNADMDKQDRDEGSSSAIDTVSSLVSPQIKTTPPDIVVTPDNSSMLNHTNSVPSHQSMSTLHPNDTADVISSDTNSATDMEHNLRKEVKVTMSFKNLDVSLNYEEVGKKLAVISAKGLIGKYTVRHDSTVRMDGSLQSLMVLDMSMENTEYQEILTPPASQTGSLIKFRYETFLRNDINYPGHDADLHIQTTEVRIVYLHRFISEVSNYFSESTTQHAVFDDVYGNAIQAVKNETSKKELKWRIDMDSPLILLPRNSTTSDMLFADLGRIEVATNSLVEHEEKVAETVITCNSMRLRTVLHGGHEHFLTNQVNISVILKSFSPEMHFDIADVGPRYAPEHSVTTVEIDPVMVNLSDEQYALILGIADENFSENPSMDYDDAVSTTSSSLSGSSNTNSTSSDGDDGETETSTGTGGNQISVVPSQSHKARNGTDVERLVISEQNWNIKRLDFKFFADSEEQRPVVNVLFTSLFLHKVVRQNSSFAWNFSIKSFQLFDMVHSEFSSAGNTSLKQLIGPGEPVWDHDNMKSSYIKPQLTLVYEVSAKGDVEVDLDLDRLRVVIVPEAINAVIDFFSKPAEQLDASSQNGTVQDEDRDDDRLSTGSSTSTSLSTLMSDSDYREATEIPAVHKVTANRLGVPTLRISASQEFDEYHMPDDNDDDEFDLDLEMAVFLDDTAADAEDGLFSDEDDGIGNHSFDIGGLPDHGMQLEYNYNNRQQQQRRSRRRSGSGSGAKRSKKKEKKTNLIVRVRVTEPEVWLVQDLVQSTVLVLKSSLNMEYDAHSKHGLTLKAEAKQLGIFIYRFVSVKTTFNSPTRSSIKSPSRSHPRYQKRTTSNLSVVCDHAILQPFDAVLEWHTKKRAKPLLESMSDLDKADEKINGSLIKPEQANKFNAGISVRVGDVEVEPQAGWLQMDPIVLRMAFNDIAMVMKIKEQLEILNLGTENNIDDDNQEDKGSSEKDDSAKVTVRSLSSTGVQKFRLDPQTITMTLVNDSFGQDTPLAELRLFNTGFQLHDWDSLMMIGKAHMQLEVDYHNHSIVMWEPLIETWSCHMHLTRNPLLQIFVHSDTVFNVNVSKAMLDTVLDVMDVLKKETHRRNRNALTKEALDDHRLNRSTSGSDLSSISSFDGTGSGAGVSAAVTLPGILRNSNEFYPYRIHNDTGQTVEFEIEDLYGSMEIGEHRAIKLKTSALNGLSHSRSRQQTLIMRVSLTSPGWKSHTIRVPINLVGIRSYSVFRSKSTTGMMSSSSDGEDQRGDAITLVCQITFKNGCRTVQLRSAVMLTNNTSLALDVMVVNPVEEERGYSKSMSTVDRLEELMDRAGGIVGSDGWEIQEPTTTRDVTVTVVQPGGVYALPMHQVQKGQLVLRPTMNGSQRTRFYWGLDQNSNHFTCIPQRSSESTSSSSSSSSSASATHASRMSPNLPLRFVTRKELEWVDAYNGKLAQQRIVVDPPLIFENLLGIPVDVRVQDQQSGVSTSKHLLSGEFGQFHEVEPNHDVTFQLGIAPAFPFSASVPLRMFDHKTGGTQMSNKTGRRGTSEGNGTISDTESFKEDEKSAKSLFSPDNGNDNREGTDGTLGALIVAVDGGPSVHTVRLRDKHGRILNVRVQFEWVSSDIRKLVLFVPYWIINRTGQLLSYRQKVRFGRDLMAAGLESIQPVSVPKKTEPGADPLQSLDQSSIASHVGSKKGGIIKEMSEIDNATLTMEVNPRGLKTYGFSSFAEPFMFAFPSEGFTSGYLSIKSNDSSWSDGFKIDTVGATDTVTIPGVTAGSENRKGSYDVGVTVGLAEGRFNLTKIVTISPRYVLVNYTQRHVHFRQSGCKEWFGLAENVLTPLIWTKASDEPKELEFRFAEVVDIVMVPKFDNENAAEEEQEEQEEQEKPHDALALEETTKPMMDVEQVEYISSSDDESEESEPENPQSEPDKQEETDIVDAIVFMEEKEETTERWNWSGGLLVHHPGEYVVKIRGTCHGEPAVYMMRVEVKLDNATILVVLRDELPRVPPFRISNRTTEQISYKQEGSHSKKEYLDPFQDRAYAWDHPSSPYNRLVVEFERSGQQQVFALDSITMFSPVTLTHADGDYKVYCEVYPDGPTRVLRISDPRVHGVAVNASRGGLGATGEMVLKEMMQRDAEDTMLSGLGSLKISLSGLGVSVVDGKPRELLYLSVSQVSASILNEGESQHMSMQIGSIQVDNQMPHTTFPVMLIPRSNDQAFLSVAAVRKLGTSSIQYYEFLHVDVQSIDLKIDEVLLMELLNFYQKLDFVGGSAGETASITSAESSRGTGTGSVLIPSQVLDHSQKLYFEELVISKIDVRLSFAATTRNVEERNPIRALIKAFGFTLKNVEDFSLSLDRVVMKNPFVTGKQLRERIAQNYYEQVFRQLYRFWEIALKVVLHADALGNLQVLFTSLWRGTTKLLMQPLDTLLYRPLRLPVAIVRGVEQFVRHLVFGVANTLCKLSGSWGQAVAFLSFDDDYMRRQDELWHRKTNDNWLDLLMNALLSLSGGVIEGITGLWRSPLRGFEDAGFWGFLRGMIVGTVGTVVKPVAGLLGFISKISELIRNIAIPPQIPERKRAPRFIGSDRVIRPYRKEDVIGQRALKLIEHGKFWRTDQFHSFTETKSGKKRREAVLFTTKRLILFDRERFSVLWEMPLNDIVSVEIDPENPANVRLHHFEEQWKFCFVFSEPQLRSKQGQRFQVRKQQEGIGWKNHRGIVEVGHGLPELKRDHGKEHRYGRMVIYTSYIHCDTEEQAASIVENAVFLLFPGLTTLSSALSGRNAMQGIVRRGAVPNNTSVDMDDGMFDGDDSDDDSDDESSDDENDNTAAGFIRAMRNRQNRNMIDGQEERLDRSVNWENGQVVGVSFGLTLDE